MRLPGEDLGKTAFAYVGAGSFELMAEQMTRATYQLLLEQLDRLEGDDRQEIADAIRHARGFGDITENAEYQAALDDQARLEARISKLRTRLERATLVDTTNETSGIVRLGSRVEVEDDAGRRLTVRIENATASWTSRPRDRRSARRCWARASETAST